MKSVVLKIDGMSCSACSNGLEKFLNNKDGINASVNLVMATAKIDYEDNITIEEIEKYISDAGFKSLGEEKLFNEDNDISFKTYLIYGLLCLIIMYISMAHMLHLPIFSFLNCKKFPIVYSTVLLLLTIPFLIYGFDIIKNGIKNLIHKMPNMDTLVTIGVLSSFLFSFFSVIMIYIGNLKYIESLYFESCVFVIYFIKLGKYIDKKSKNKTLESLKDLVKITPDKARIKVDNGYKDITIDEVKKDDLLVCLPGDRIAVDGEIIKGESHFDESFITGESIPVLKNKGDKVIAGSINYEGTIEYKAEKIGKDSTISEIVRLVVDSTNSKVPISKLVDKICFYFVPVVIVLAILTFIINVIITKDISTSLIRFVTVLVIACPCSLGLATPLALVISVGNAAKNNLLIKNSESIETVSKVSTIVFDKTGTLTNGILSISRINNHCDLPVKDVLELLGSIELNSTHPLAYGINRYIKVNNIKTYDLVTEDLVGYGVKGKDNKNNVYYACNSALLKKLDIINSYEAEEKEMSKDGNSVIYLVRNKKVIATFGLKDVVRDEAKAVVEKLNSKGLNIIMLSGDNEITAKKIADSIGISNVIAGVTPKEKNKYIKDLISKGEVVMMVGDGINDAPSLTTASVGVSLKNSTDIATNSSDVVIASDNLNRIVDFIDIGTNTIKNIKQNLVWAFLYNVIMIPLAMGLFGISINPMIACIMMIFSSITVTINALRLRKK